MHAPPTRQPNLRDLPLRRIRFLRLHGADLQTDTFHLWTIFEGGRDALPGADVGAGLA